MTIVSNVTAFDNRRQWNNCTRQMHFWNITSNDMACNDLRQWKNCYITSHDTIANDDMIANDRWMDHLQHEQCIVCSHQHDRWITLSVIDCKDAIKGMGLRWPQTMKKLQHCKSWYDLKWWYDCKRLQQLQAMIRSQMIATSQQLHTMIRLQMIDGWTVCSARDGSFAACSTINESLSAQLIVGMWSKVWYGWDQS